MISIPANVQAHDPQNYTILLFEDGPTPEGVVPGILVENDSLFVRNHDTRENVSHRFVIDLDGNDIFTGVDDYATGWLNSSCELNETGEKIDENCNAHEIINLAASNGFLQGNISIKHQIKMGENITEFDFFVNFGPDIHDMDENLPTGNEPIEENDDSNRTLIFVLLIFSIIGILLIVPQLIKSNE
ncbi:MAG: hypothetical protein CND89_04675 [Marine Group II euryarchaeote MED-G38]|nr:MAG: hypothetical protein CND89_04675 [Marine Group II euryarchaeote MED-G38]|tara:strand:- start:97 stop:657 length:561 start_codon:yes stop_codon:yes gene_type:complete